MNKEINGNDLKKKLNEIGKAGKADVAEAVQAELGDMSMSHWRRGRPINLVAGFTFPSSYQVEIRPSPRARGPFRVLEEGRRSGGAYDLVQVGRVRTKGKNAGTRRAKSRGRNQGGTGAKETWSDAVNLMELRMPDRVDEFVVKVAIRRAGV